MTYRAAVIGDTGRGGYSHGLDLCFAGLPGVEVVAVADPNEAGRAAAQARIGAARAYADYREMLARERPDVVSVAPAWMDQREAMVVAAAESGVRAIYCEKPFAQSLDQADRMLAACDARRVKVAVAHQNRGWPAVWLVGDLIAGGKIGRLRAMRAWPKQDARGGGVEHLIHGTHMFDLMRLFASLAGQGQTGAAGQGADGAISHRQVEENGKAQAAAGQWRGRPPARAESADARWCHARVTVQGRDATPADVTEGMYAAGPICGDDITAAYGFDGGVTGTWESIQAADGGGTPYLRMEVSGTGGTLAFWSSGTTPIYFCPRPFLLPDQPGEWQRVDYEAPAISAGVSHLHVGNQALLRDLLAAVEDDRPPVSSGHDARAALEMILAAYESHAAGARVALPLAERAHPLLRWR